MHSLCCLRLSLCLGLIAAAAFSADDRPVDDWCQGLDRRAILQMMTGTSDAFILRHQDEFLAKLQASSSVLPQALRLYVGRLLYAKCRLNYRQAAIALSAVFEQVSTYDTGSAESVVAAYCSLFPRKISDSEILAGAKSVGWVIPDEIWKAGLWRADINRTDSAGYRSSIAGAYAIGQPQNTRTP